MAGFSFDRPPRAVSSPVAMDWEPSAEASTSTLPSVLVGFSNQEKSGKILPCVSVKEDGLMRIEPDTVRLLSLVLPFALLLAREC